MPSTLDFTALPGGDLVERGLRDLTSGTLSQEALLVLIGAHRLRRAGIDVPDAGVKQPEHAPCLSLHAEDQDSAHSRYNALIRRLISFERAAEALHLT